MSRSGAERILLPIAPMVRKADTPMSLIKLVIWDAILVNGRKDTAKVRKL